MKFITALVLLFSLNLVQAQSANEIIDSYIEVMGGKENMYKIKSISSKGTAKAQGMELPVEQYFTDQGKTFLSYEIQGLKIIQAFNGETSWGTNFQTMKPERSSDEDSKNAKTEALLDYPLGLVNYKDENQTVELLGEENKEGVDCFKIRRVGPPVLVEGKEEENADTFFIDKETFALIGIESMVQSGPGKGATSFTIFSDYQEVDGVYFPFTVESRINGNLQFSYTANEVVFNQEIDEDIFEYKGE